MSAACEVHDFQPVNNMRAVYRCSECGMFAYKAGARIGFGPSDSLTPYRCHKPGCDERVVVIFPVVRARKRHQPSCQLHRKDKT
jgi:hypothetical protein